MPSRLKRYQQTGQLHYVTFTCYHRRKYLHAASARDTFEETLERVQRWYGLKIVGYVVMPEHVHLLVSEPEHFHPVGCSADARNHPETETQNLMSPPASPKPGESVVHPAG